MKKISVLLLVVFLSVPSNVFAVGSAGFENASFSAKSIGEGNATVAQADEAAAISYNPAGITDLPGLNIQGNVGLINSWTRISQNGSSSYSSGTTSVVPTGYLTIHPGDYLGDRFAFGFGSDSPFGLANKYDSNHPSVHYTGYRNYLKMFTLKPTVAVKVHKKLSIGGGPVLYRVTDFGGIQAYPNIIAAGLGIPGSILTDGQVRLNLEGHRWGWQIGAKYKPAEKHALGFYFRNPVTIHTHGTAKVENSASGNFETGVNARLDLPLNVTVGYAYHINSKTVVEADFGYTRWAAHKRLFFNADPVNFREDVILQAIGKADKDYNDSYSIHLGGQHKINEKTEIRLGSFFYTAAVPGDHYIPAIADGNRLGLTAGAGREIIKNLKFDFAYMAHLVLRNSIDNGISEPLGTTVDGKYFTYIQGIYFTISYKWDELFKREAGVKEVKINSDLNR